MVEKLWLRKCFYPYLNSIIIIIYNNAVSYRYNLYCKHFMKCNLKSQLWFQLQHQRVEIKSNVVIIKCDQICTYYYVLTFVKIII